MAATSLSGHWLTKADRPQPAFSCRLEVHSSCPLLADSVTTRMRQEADTPEREPSWTGRRSLRSTNWCYRPEAEFRPADASVGFSL